MKRIIVLILACAVLGCGEKNQGAINNANKLYAKGEYNLAISKTLQALRKYEYSSEEKAELTYIMAQSHEKLGELEKSMKLYAYIVEQYPNTRVSILAKTEIK